MIFLFFLIASLGGVVAGGMLMAFGLVTEPITSALWLVFGLTILWHIWKAMNKNRHAISNARVAASEAHDVATRVAIAHAVHFPKKVKDCKHRRSFVQRGAVTELLPCDICG